MVPMVAPLGRAVVMPVAVDEVTCASNADVRNSSTDKVKKRTARRLIVFSVPGTAEDDHYKNVLSILRRLAAATNGNGNASEFPSR